MKPLPERTALLWDECRETVQELVTEKDAKKAERLWRDFVVRLDKAWERTKKHYALSPKWNGWQQRRLNLIRSDPLLIYLQMARDSENHNNEGVSDVAPGQFRMGLSNARVGDEFSAYVRFNSDGSVDVRPETPGEFVSVPPHVALRPAVTRGRTYPIPSTHAGRTIERQTPLHFAELAMAFYEPLLLEAAEFFAERPAP
jgi:hypothetical protein